MKDGWHEISGNTVYVEDGYIIRGMKQNGLGAVSAYIYRKCRNGNGWDREDKITPDAFRAGCRRGTIILN